MANFVIGAGKVGQDKVGISGAAAPVVDDDGGWWAGAQQCFVGVAIAGAAVALSVSTAIAGGFKHNDEVLPAPVAHTHSAIGTQRAQHATTFVKFSQSDELPAASFAPADDGGWAPPQLAAAPLSLFQPWDSAEELPFIRLEEDAWAPPAPVIQSVTVSMSLWAHEDFVAPVPVLEESEWAALPPQGALPAALAWTAEDELPATQPQVADEHWQRFDVVAGVPLLALWTDTDEFVPPAGATIGSDTSSIAPNTRAQHGTSFIRFYQPDDFPAPVVGVVEEYEWGNERSADTRVAQQQDAAQDELAPIAPATVEEDYWFKTETALLPAVLSISTDTEELPFAVTVAVDIEQFSVDIRVIDKVDYTVWRDTEDFAPTPPDPAGTETTSSVGTQRARAQTSFVRLHQQDEFPNVVVLTVDEEHPWNFDQRSADSFTYVVWAENDEFAPPATPMVDEYPWALGIPPPAAQVRFYVPAAVDEVFVAAAPAISEYEWAFSFTTAIAQAKSYIPVVFDEAFFPAPVIDEDQAWDFNRRSLDSFTYVVWAENDEFAPSVGIRDEYEWIFLARIIQSKVHSYIPVTTDELAQPPFFLNDEYTWVPVWMAVPTFAFDLWLFNDDRHTAPVIPPGDRIENRYFLANVSTLMGI